MSDTINRQDAIDTVTRYCNQYDLRELLADIEVLPSAELQGKCNGCFYLDSNGATCEFCARNYPDRYSAKTEGDTE